jgi:hypothetical protein
MSEQQLIYTSTKKCPIPDLLNLPETGHTSSHPPENNVMLEGEVVQVAVDTHQLTILEYRLPKHNKNI